MLLTRARVVEHSATISNCNLPLRLCGSACGASIGQQPMRAAGVTKGLSLEETEWAGDVARNNGIARRVGVCQTVVSLGSYSGPNFNLFAVGRSLILHHSLWPPLTL